MSVRNKFVLPLNRSGRQIRHHYPPVQYAVELGYLPEHCAPETPDSRVATAASALRSVVGLMLGGLTDWQSHSSQVQSNQLPGGSERQSGPTAHQIPPPVKVPILDVAAAMIQYVQDSAALRPE